MAARAMLAIAALVAAVPACRRSAAPTSWLVPSVSLELPRRSGWIASTTTPAAGAVALRLERDQAVAGSPRVDVVLDAPAAGATTLDELVERNLREMRALEASGAIHLDHVEQTPVAVGPRRALRVRHEYVLAPADIAITQVSLFLVVDGRGVAITAVGRTELFTPLAGEVDALLAGIRVLEAPASLTEVPR